MFGKFTAKQVKKAFGKSNRIFISKCGNYISNGYLVFHTLTINKKDEWIYKEIEMAKGFFKVEVIIYPIERFNFKDSIVTYEKTPIVINSDSNLYIRMYKTTTNQVYNYIFINEEYINLLDDSSLLYGQGENNLLYDGNRYDNSTVMVMPCKVDEQLCKDYIKGYDKS